MMMKFDDEKVCYLLPNDMMGYLPLKKCFFFFCPFIVALACICWKVERRGGNVYSFP